jgi:hypothetical protein
VHVLRAGERVVLPRVSAIEKKTAPLKRFTDASLLRAMTGIARFVSDPTIKALLRESDGIGTPRVRCRAEVSQERVFPWIGTSRASFLGVLSEVGNYVTRRGRLFAPGAPPPAADPNAEIPTIRTRLSRSSSGSRWKNKSDTRRVTSAPLAVARNAI